MGRRKKKNTFWSDMATGACLKALVSMSSDGMLPEVKYGEFPSFQVYPSKDTDIGQLCTDLPCMLGDTQEDKSEMAEILIEKINEQFANNPFNGIMSKRGFVYFALPTGVVLPS